MAAGPERGVASAETGVWLWLGRQLAHPEGPGGRMVGRLMALANRGPYRRALAALDVWPGQRILEIGVGPGAGLRALLKAAGGGPVCGIDASSEMIALARRRNAGGEAAARLDLRHAEAARLPFSDGAFDRLLAVNVAYFLDARAVAEIRRVLAPGGRAVLYVTDRASMARWRFAGPLTHTTYDEAALRALLVAGGFPHEEVRTVSCRLPFGIRGLVAIAQRGRRTGAEGGRCRATNSHPV